MKPVTQIDRTSKVGSTVGAAIVDPVCGMTVNPDSAAGSYEYDGSTYYFCSSHCLNKFRENPEAYVKETTKTAPSPLVPIQRPKQGSPGGYTCPMHPEVKQDKPGSCPKCGMALEPISVTAPQQ